MIYVYARARNTTVFNFRQSILMEHKVSNMQKVLMLKSNTFYNRADAKLQQGPLVLQGKWMSKTQRTQEIQLKAVPYFTF